MDEREHYIGILGKAAELASAPDRAETARRIDRRIMNQAAAGAVRTGVPVRISDDGLFLTIDLGGRSYTVIASAVEAALREDYDRALSVCRRMAAKAYEDLSEDSGTGDTDRTDVSKGTERGCLRVISSSDTVSEHAGLRFESRLAAGTVAVPLPEDRGDGSAPRDLLHAERRFGPAQKTAEPVIKKVTAVFRGFPVRKKQFRFLAEPSAGNEFFLTVSDPETGRILYRERCGEERAFSAAGVDFRVIGIRKDGVFHLGVMPGSASAESCTLRIDDE